MARSEPTHESLVIPLYIAIGSTFILFVVYLGFEVYNMKGNNNTIAIWVLSK